MQQDPFAPKYGNIPQAPQPIPTYGGMPVQPNKKGINILLLPLILAIFLLSGSIVFGIWAYSGMQDYKNNVQPKIDKAVALAQQETATAKDAEFVEKEKSPVKEYKTSQTAGSITIQYPKTWSAVVTEDEKANETVDGYFHPSYVPGVNKETDYALRLKVVSQSYDEVLKQFEARAKSGKLVISPYKAPKMGEGAVGVRIVGEINTGQQNNMVIFPLRDKTIQISTESNQFLGDFNSIILANLTFVP
jgi:hypothetical protein